MSNEKPKGMRIGESVFCAGYLVFAFVAGIVFLAHRSGATAGFASSCAAMTLLLGGGDAFHLVPRILINVQGDAKSAYDERRRSYWLGLGNLVSSITMTFFYVLLPSALHLMPGNEGAGTPGAQLVRVLLIGLAIVRVALCLFPQNHWFDGTGSQQWGVYRNLPFVAMGAITILYLLIWYQARLLAALVAASFACYMGVVLYAKKNPMMGMLMIPKTICYIWMIALFLRAL